MKKYNNYLVMLNTSGEFKRFKIEQTVNRCNNPDDEELIEDYVRVKLGEKNGVVFSDCKYEVLCSEILIDEKYQIEV